MTVENIELSAWAKKNGNQWGVVERARRLRRRFQSV